MFTKLHVLIAVFIGMILGAALTLLVLGTATYSVVPIH